jgi:hypothetical protein
MVDGEDETSWKIFKLAPRVDLIAIWRLQAHTTSNYK